MFMLISLQVCSTIRQRLSGLDKDFMHDKSDDEIVD